MHVSTTDDYNSHNNPILSCLQGFRQDVKFHNKLLFKNRGRWINLIVQKDNGPTSQVPQHKLMSMCVYVCLGKEVCVMSTDSHVSLGFAAHGHTCHRTPALNTSTQKHPLLLFFFPFQQSAVPEILLFF